MNHQQAAQAVILASIAQLRVSGRGKQRKVQETAHRRAKS